MTTTTKAQMKTANAKVPVQIMATATVMTNYQKRLQLQPAQSTSPSHTVIGNNNKYNLYFTRHLQTKKTFSYCLHHSYGKSVIGQRF